MINRLTLENTTNPGRRPKNGRLLPYLMIAPGLVLLVVWNYIPTIYALWLSLNNYQPGLTMKFVGLQNYVQALNSPDFWNSVLRSAEYLLMVPVLVIVPLIFAVFMNQKLPGIRILRAMYFIPVVLSMVVVSILFSEIFQSNGLLNDLLLSFHAIHQSIPWLTIPKLAIFFVMITTIWKGVGWYMIIYLAALQSIPEELYEAAKIDGAGFFRRIRNVTIPGIWMYMIVVMIMCTTASLSVFTEVYLITEGGPLQATTTMFYYLYHTSFVNYNYGYGAAVGVIIWAILISISVAQYFISRGRMTT